MTIAEARALEEIAEDEPYLEHSIHGERWRCGQCWHAWVRDKETEHHGPKCAYVVARAALRSEPTGEQS